MRLSNRQDNALEDLCLNAIEHRLGDISGLPQNVVAHVLIVYREFVACYLNILRQSGNKPADWMPDSLFIDPELTDGMRHFFSDYQHITRKFYILNYKIERLLQIDKSSRPDRYHHAIEDILKYCHRPDEQVGENNYAR
ncbi:MAG: hypothetical protein JRF72_12480 [Deltaproteobacteria bacterium]|jgi:hypothetical protein|nr:hypothetical protein [Deltaproteobacteria bacterium]